jgi:hypothetical protein
MMPAFSVWRGPRSAASPRTAPAPSVGPRRRLFAHWEIPLRHHELGGVLPLGSALEGLGQCEDIGAGLGQGAYQGAIQVGSGSGGRIAQPSERDIREYSGNTQPESYARAAQEAAYRISLKSLARRYLELHDEIADLDTIIGSIVDDLAPELVARNSIGHTGAAQLLLTAGDNPERLRSEASFAALCGVSPVPASSGKTVRHRLNRGGDRAANSALHIIAIGRLRTDPATKAYVAKRIAGGHSKLDAIRSLKRSIAREVFHIITRRHREINQPRIAA